MEYRQAFNGHMFEFSGREALRELFVPDERDEIHTIREDIANILTTAGIIDQIDRVLECDDIDMVRVYLVFTEASHATYFRMLL